jgi:hypothetical protein
MNQVLTRSIAAMTSNDDFGKPKTKKMVELISLQRNDSQIITQVTRELTKVNLGT